MPVESRGARNFLYKSAAVGLDVSQAFDRRRNREIALQPTEARPHFVGFPGKKIVGSSVQTLPSVRSRVLVRGEYREPPATCRGPVWLGDSGLDVVAVASAAEALALLSREHFDVVVADWLLQPPERGDHLLDEIRDPLSAHASRLVLWAGRARCVVRALLHREAVERRDARARCSRARERREPVQDECSCSDEPN